MGILRNIKQERFARLIAKGLTKSKAYKIAGYTGHDSNAYHLYNGDNTSSHRVRQRVAEIMRDTSEIQQREILDEVFDTATLAKESGQYNAALKGFEMFGKELGLWRDRKENVNINLNSLDWNDTESYIRDRYGSNAETFIKLVKEYYHTPSNNNNSVQNQQLSLVAMSINDDDNDS